MKKGPLSKKEKAYIKANLDSSSNTIIADDMDRSVHVVDKFVSTLNVEVKTEEKTEEKTPDAKPSQAAGASSNLFARNKKQGVTVMTEAASSRSDEARNIRRQAPKRQNNMIHIIKKD